MLFVCKNKEDVLKNTKQREVILRVIDKMKREKLHYKVEDVYLYLKSQGYSINLSTIYRNFNDFVDKGLLLKFILSDGTAVYDANVFEHAHFKCLKCGKIEDLFFKDMGIDFKKEVLEDRGYRVKNISVIVEGICGDCFKKN